MSIASLGVTFQMFNAAFPSELVETRAALEERLRAAKNHFDSQALRWAFWICEDWLAAGIRRKLSGACAALGVEIVVRHARHVRRTPPAARASPPRH